MSILTYPLGFIGGGKEFYNGVIENSLRFNDDDSQQLNLTYATAGDRTKYSFSCWFKKATHGIDLYIFAAGTGNSGWTEYVRLNSDKIKFNISDTDAQEAAIETNALFRDNNAWYHVVAVYDSANGVEGDRQRLYVN